MKNSLKLTATITLLALVGSMVEAGPDRPTKFSNTNSVANSRHNLTQRTIGAGSVFMDGSRNDYGEVCVYCHTPHGSNTNVTLPLWNRTVANTTYTTYSALGSSTITQTITQPGANSLSCLTCHDGTTAVDSIINMPGSNGYRAAQASTQNNAFLDTWSKGGDGAGGPTAHAGFNNGGAAACMTCHQPTALGGLPNATDFTVFNLGTDLTNDHPVGITYPGSNADFKATTAKVNGITYFETDGNGRLSKGDIRLYDTAGVAKVECASCHDPHGVPSGGAGSTFNPTFLRISNAGSAVCLTCHNK